MGIRTVSSILPALAFIVPLLGAAGVGFSGRVSERTRDIGLAIVCAATFAIAVALVALTLSGQTPEAHLVQVTPNIWMYMRVDPMGALYGWTASLLWLIAMVYSTAYMADEHRKGRYYAFFMLCLGWTMGVAYSGNLLTFLIFYELFSILTYPLVVHEETPEAMAAGTKYIIYILIGGSLVLLAIVFTFFLAGDQTFTLGGLLTADMGRNALVAIFWCFIAGFGVKAALVPLHGWVPDAHPAAPAPFSAVLSGVMVAAGSFGIMRVAFFVFGADLLAELGAMTWLGYIAAFTVVFAAILAVNQDNIKRRLAYSTISQMGYVALGTALMGHDALVGALIHIANHAFMKGTLFLCAGVLIKRAGLHRVSEMDGAAKRFPITMAAFALAALGMIGTPPLSGFVSKWFLGLGMLEVSQPYYLVVLIGGALLAAVYLLPIVYKAYFKPPPPTVQGDGDEKQSEAPWTMLVPVLAASALTVVLGIAASIPGLPLSLARMVADAVFR